MNNDPQLTDEQSRLATTRVLPDGAALDAETAAAREGFLVLGAALESAASHIDEQALVDQILGLSVGSAESRVEVAVRSPARRDWLPLVLGGALAASALIAIARIVLISHQDSAAMEVAQAPRDSALTKAESPVLTAASWNDSLDDEIALAALAIEHLATRHPGFDGLLSEMNERLEALSQELSGESL
jgi:hypothetical protein